MPTIPEYAFPRPTAATHAAGGMILRDYIAAKAMDALLVGTAPEDNDEFRVYAANIAARAYFVADKMMIRKDQ